jgi:DNA-binding NarL/FixJ family response regulator
LRRANCIVLTAADGESALAFAKHVAVDAFVLLSTGNSMGRVETALNLRDIRPFTEIIFVARETGESTRGEAVAQAIPNTRVLTLQQLGDYLASPTSSSSPAS